MSVSVCPEEWVSSAVVCGKGAVLLMGLGSRRAVSYLEEPSLSPRIHIAMRGNSNYWYLVVSPEEEILRGNASG